jgi:hypothetical protein
MTSLPHPLVADFHQYFHHPKRGIRPLIKKLINTFSLSSDRFEEVAFGGRSIRPG